MVALALEKKLSYFMRRAGCMSESFAIFSKFAE